MHHRREEEEMRETMEAGVETVEDVMKDEGNLSSHTYTHVRKQIAGKENRKSICVCVVIN